MSDSSLRIAALGGPTASGKTAAVVALRRDFGLPVEAINFDALQVYRELEAGTAKPTPAERAAVPYHLVDVTPPTEAMTAARYAESCDAVIADVHRRGAWPVLVGGTGLYLRAVLRGLAAIPEVPAEVRAQLAAEWQTRGPAALHAELATADPEYAARTPAANRQRLLRALEVLRATGRPFSAFHHEHQAAPDRYACWTVVLEPPRDVLVARIDARAAAMAAPLYSEVQHLLARGLAPDAPAMQALGYREAVALLGRGEGPAALVPLLAAAHRAYAKKQSTWFRAVAADRRVPGADAASLQVVAADLRRWFAEKS